MGDGVVECLGGLCSILMWGGGRGGRVGGGGDGRWKSR